MPRIRQTIVAALTRHYPFYSGCGTLANSSLVRCLAGRGSDRSWVKLRSGCYVRVALDDFNGRGAYFTRDVDRKITWICSRVVRPGDIVLDVGANIGLVTFTLAPIVGPTGHVHAFEPNPQSSALIEQAIAYNQMENITLHSYALGDHECRLALAIPHGHSGRASLTRSATERGMDRVLVPVRRLSEVIREEVGPSRIRLVKIDVEGFEPQVLIGAQRTFSENPPDVVVAEQLDEVGTGVHREPSTLGILAELGYRLFGIPRSWFAPKLRPLSLGTPTPIGHDIVAVRRGTVGDEIVALLTP